MTSQVAYAHCVRSCEMGYKQSNKPKQDNSMMMLMMLGGFGGGSKKSGPPDFYKDLPSGEDFIKQIEVTSSDDDDDDDD